MPTAIKPDAKVVKYTRITTPGTNVRIHAAGADWAGISEVPTASLSAAQLEALRNTEGLTVEEAEDRPAEPT